MDYLFRLRAEEAQTSTAGRVQVMGSNIAGTEVGAGVFGPGAGGVIELKHGIVQDSLYGAPVRSLLFRVYKDDPPTSGATAQRCERYFSSSAEIIPQGRDFWFATRIKSSSWDSLTRRIIWQWHDGSEFSGLSPHLSATIDGDRLRIILLHNSNTGNLSAANTTQVVIYENSSWQAGIWNDFVVKANVNPEGGYAQVWINGSKVAEYAGPFGYSYSNPKDYAKIGIYHWNSETNQWRPEGPDSVEVRATSAILLLDQSGMDSHFIRSLL